jgi:hypothetical protein
MRIFALVLICSLVCAACAKPLTTLSDGRPGYAVYCDTVRTRCMDEIALLCRDKSPMIVSERAQEVSLPIGWIETGGPLPKFNSRYWMEVRCDP